MNYRPGRELFYLFHILLFSITLYCFSSVLISNVVFKNYYEGMSVREHLKILNDFGSAHKVIFDLVMAIGVFLSSVSTYFGIRKKKFFLPSVWIIILVAILLYDLSFYYKEIDEFEASNHKIYLFSYLNLMIYSMHTAIVLLLHGIVYYFSSKHYYPNTRF